MYGRRSPAGPYIMAVVVAVVIYAAIYLGQLMWPSASRPMSWNPLAAAIQLTTGEAAWSPGSTVLLAVVALGFIVLLVVLWRRGGKSAGAGPSKGSRRMTDFERRVNADQDTARIQQRRRQAEMQHLHPDTDIAEAGVQVGRALDRGRGWVFQSYRQCSAHIWGPGRGKTLTQVVRHSYYAPGAYVMTSNKTDGVKYVLAARALRHPSGRVWMFDPNRIFRDGDRPAFTIDLLSAVNNTESAERLAGMFEKAAPTAKDVGGDAQFDPQGREFLAWCMLAAAVSGKPLRQVHLWVSEGNYSDTADILSDVGYVGPVAALRGLGKQPEKTRGSVFATAQRMASAMVHDHLMAWATPAPGIPVFDPARFALSKDTLVLLTNQKAGALAAFVSALVTQVVDAGIVEAQKHSSGRLPFPMIVDADECGNAVTLPDMPDWYTHVGSKGIILNAYFQSPAQGEETFGKARFEQLWDAAGMRVYGGGIDNDRWLRGFSDLIGKYDKTTHSTTTSQGTQSRSVSTQEHARASVAELANLPEWRAIVRTSNGVSVVVETVPVFKDPAFAEVIRAGDLIGVDA